MRHAHPSTVRASHRVAVPIEVPGAAAPGQWLVCGGAIREVTSGGRVVCPLHGAAVTIGECLGCHCLVTHSGERDPMTDCALPELR